MNKQTTLVLSMAMSTLLIPTISSADLQGISHESFDSGLGIGTTYRIYADVDAGDQVDAIFGDAVNPLSIQTSTSFYQNQFGDYGAPTESLFGFFPSLEYDSFVTIGKLNDTGDAMLDIGIDWSTFEDNGGDIWSENGTWFATPDDAQVYEEDGRVLLAQFTTDGTISGELNILGKNEDLTSWQYSAVALPAPGAIVLLGLAGYLRVRRRH
jgi:hypothetical protein